MDFNALESVAIALPFIIYSISLFLLGRESPRSGIPDKNSFTRYFNTIVIIILAFTLLISDGRLLQLLLALFAPLAFSYLLANLTLSIQHKNFLYVITDVSLKPSKGILSQPLFWMLIYVPLSFSIFAYAGFFKSAMLNLRFSVVKDFYELDHGALWILTATFPIAVLISRIHATVQTADQIEALTKTNNIDRYYKHREMFEKDFKEYNKTTKVINLKNMNFELSIERYRALFPSSPQDGRPELSQERIKNVADVLQSTLDDIMRIYNEAEDDIVIMYATIMNRLYYVDNVLQTRILSELNTSTLIAKSKSFGEKVEFISAKYSSRESILIYNYFICYMETVGALEIRPLYDQDSIGFYDISYKLIENSVAEKVGRRIEKFRAPALVK